MLRSVGLVPMLSLLHSFFCYIMIVSYGDFSEIIHLIHQLHGVVKNKIKTSLLYLLNSIPRFPTELDSFVNDCFFRDKMNAVVCYFSFSAYHCATTKRVGGTLMREGKRWMCLLNIM